ncbi:MAG: Smr/MutS family protein [Betaproteobacteria bacterium]
MPTRHKSLSDLATLRDRLGQRAAEHERQARADVERLRRAEHSAGEFAAAMTGVTPLAPHGRHQARPQQPAPHARQRQHDDARVLDASLSDEIDLDALLDTDDSLSWRRPGIGPDVLRRLRRGAWSIQSQIDLHGCRVDEARSALADFLRDAVKRGLRCVRVVHGKGLGSKDRVPVLKTKVRGWLVQREEVIAFCQARPAEGGAGALIVLLRPGEARATGA